MKQALLNCSKGLSSLAHACSNITETLAIIGAENQKRKMEKAKDFARIFRLEITQTFFGKRIKAIQRDEPLTDEQLSKLGF